MADEVEEEAAVGDAEVGGAPTGLYEWIERMLEAGCRVRVREEPLVLMR